MKRKLVSLALALCIVASLLCAGSFSLSASAYAPTLKTETLSAGLAHSVAIKSDGSLWAWGDNEFGQLGNNTKKESLVPIQVMTDVVSVSAGGAHTLAIKKDGSLWAWGDNSYGQLGDGTIIERLKPVKIMDGVVCASAGLDHSVVVKKDGTVWAWGSNEAGQLGIEDPWYYPDEDEDDWYSSMDFASLMKRFEEPVKAKKSLRGSAKNNAISSGMSSYITSSEYDPDDEYPDYPEVDTTIPNQAMIDNVSSVSAGLEYTLALKKDGTVWGWGANVYGTLGFNPDEGDGYDDGYMVYMPKAIPGMTNVAAISAGYMHAMAVLADGSLWGWGTNNFNQLGLGQMYEEYYAPTKVIDAGVSSVSAGLFSTQAIKTDGTLWGWGDNNNDPYYEQTAPVGDGTSKMRSRPVKVMSDAAGVTVGLYHTIAVKADGSLWSWGINSNGQLGDGSQIMRSAPVEISNEFAGIQSGVGFAVGLKADGSLWSWGTNAYGQMGNDTKVGSPSPVHVMDDIVSYSVGVQHVMAIDKDGNLWGWGRNDGGQLGLGEEYWKNATTPQKITTDVRAAAAGGSHTLFVKNDGSLWACGANEEGQLGNRSREDSAVPVKIINSGIVSVAAGVVHSMAVDSNGALWVWGGNYSAQLGDEGSYRSRLYPIKLIDQGVKSAYAFYDRSFAILNDDSLWGWGDNSSGALGLNDDMEVIEPTMVMENVASVSSGMYHGFAVDKNGALWAWGNNMYGQVGVGSLKNEYYYEPIKIMNENVLSACAGYATSYALTSNGKMWAWGDNENGEFGNGTTGVRTSPGQISDGYMIPGAFVVPAVTKLAWKTEPTKKEYNYGDALSVAGGRFIATYNTGATQEVVLTAAMCSGYKATTVGAQTVKVTYEKQTLTFQVNVTAVLPTKIALNETTLLLYGGQSSTLKPTFTPANPSDKTLTWSSSDNAVATVSGGKVTAKAPGKAVITVKTVNGKAATCTVTVYNYVTLRVGCTKAIQNGVRTKIDDAGTKPQTVKGKTMLPVRFASEKMGAGVSYKSDKDPIVITYGGTRVEFKLNSTTMKVITGQNIATVTLDVAAQKIGGKTYIPLRAIGKALGFDVYYHDTTKIIVIGSMKMSEEVKILRVAEGAGYINS